MIKIKVIDRHKQEHTIEAHDGDTVANAIRTNISPDSYMMCGGCCACATCMVRVDKKWISKLEEISEDEQGILDDNEYSRLGCQIYITKELDGMEVVIV